MKKVLWEIFDWGKNFVIIFIVVTVVRNYIVSPVEVEGHSMHSTLRDGDRVILWELGYKPSAFDLIVYEYAEEVYHVKRLIGLPGQVVNLVDDQLYIDGIAVEEPYLEEAKESVAANPLFDWNFNSGFYTDNFTLQEVCLLTGIDKCQVIPEGYYLTLGDHRPRSTDSRQIGLIQEEKIMGKVVWIQWPPSRFGAIN